ncbi:MAG: homocysteine S-methyltransferase [Gemmatimonadota bacterium]
MPLPRSVSPLVPFLDGQGFLVLDGGLATELEARGADLRDPLWSARVLLEQPDLIRDVHRDYLAAGADVITTASYQASHAGLAVRGLIPEQADEVLRLSVRLAVEAREEWTRTSSADRLPPLVAASVGPYGAYLHDGSEYRGGYGLSAGELRAFHRDRIAVLAGAGADLLAFETIPCREEAEVLVELALETGVSAAWLTFSCRDGDRISAGDGLSEAIAGLRGAECLTAIGVNCTAPRFIGSLLETARDSTDLPLVVYPNSGECYEAASGAWSGEASTGIVDQVAAWYSLGARLIGGCCRTTPETIRGIAASLRGRGSR